MVESNDLTNTGMTPVDSGLNLVDARFNFTYDRPFDSPQAFKLTQELKSYLVKNHKIFNVVNWIKDSRSYNIPLTAPLFGIKTGKKLDSNNHLCFNVCDTLNEINNALENKLSDKLISYVESNLEKPTEAVEQPQEANQQVQDTVEDSDNKLTFDEEEAQTYTFKDANDITTYDLTSCKTINYDQLCQLCKNIARTELVVTVSKDENVLFAENREKQRLRRELNKYLKNNEISKKLNTKVEELSVIQLQQALDDAKDIYETIKVTDLITKGLNLVELGCNYAFPNGIKIPKKNKVIKLNGVGESINNLLFDRNSPLNIAYNNIIEKYNFKVSDGFLCFIGIVQAFASKLNIEDIEEEEIGSENEETTSNEGSGDEDEDDESGSGDEEETGDEDEDEDSDEDSGDSDDEE